MEIKTKFKVGDLAKRKFENQGKDRIIALEIMEVITTTCYAGTQVFYLTNAIVAAKKYKHEYSEKGDSEWIIGHAISKEDNGSGWRKHREDILIESPEGEQAIIKGLLVGNDD